MQRLSVAAASVMVSVVVLCSCQRPVCAIRKDAEFLQDEPQQCCSEISSLVARRIAMLRRACKETPDCSDENSTPPPPPQYQASSATSSSTTGASSIHAAAATTTSSGASVVGAPTIPSTSSSAPAAVGDLTTARQQIPGSERTSLDWSSSDNPLGVNVVTAVGYQGGTCNSCYVWAAVGSIESRYAIASGGPVRALSVQQALDCARSDHMTSIGKGRLTYRSSRGCETGFPEPIMQYAIDEGFMLREDYPISYDPVDGWKRVKDEDDFECLVDAGNVVVNPVDARVRSVGVKLGKDQYRSDWILKVMQVLKEGPVAVGIDKSSYQVGLDMRVREGQVGQKDCPSHNNDHAVLIVGWGTTADGTAYWKIKNSWGGSWGEHGFFKIPRGVNFCGVEKTASFIEFSAPKTP